MASLDQTLTVNVIIGPGGVPRGNFGLAMWMTHEQYSTARAASYADLDEVKAVYPSGSETRVMATTFFGQSPRPNKIIIGTKLGVVTVTPIAVNNSTYELVINGETVQFVSDADTTVDEVTLGMTAAIDVHGVVGPLTDTADNTTDFDVQSVAGSNEPISVTIPASSVDLFTISHGDDTGQSWSDGLDLIREKDDSWFVLTHQTTLQADILGLAANINALNKMHGWRSVTSGDLIEDPTSTKELLEALSYSKTFGYRDSSPLQDQHKEVAAVGNGFTRDVGQVTFKWKVLPGVTADEFTSSQTGSMDLHNLNYYSEITMGVPITQEGKVASGEYIDVMRNIAWLESNVQLDLLDLFRNEDIVHLDDTGLLQIDGVLRGRISDAVARRVLHDDVEVIVPTLAELETTNPPRRTVTGIKIIGQPVDAVHFATVTINIDLPV